MGRTERNKGIIIEERVVEFDPGGVAGFIVLVLSPVFDGEEEVPVPFLHLLLTARVAISHRRSGISFAARANPPRRANATPCLFLDIKSYREDKVKSFLISISST